MGGWQHRLESRPQGAHGPNPAEVAGRRNRPLCEKFGKKGGKGVLAYFEALEERTKEDPLATFPYDVAWIESWVELHHPRIQGGLAKLREGDVEGAVDEFRGRTGLRKEPKGQIVLSGEPFDDLSIYEDAMTRLSRGLELFASKKYPSRDDENADALMDARTASSMPERSSETFGSSLKIPMLGIRAGSMKDSDFADRVLAEMLAMSIAEKGGEDASAELARSWAEARREWALEEELANEETE